MNKILSRTGVKWDGVQHAYKYTDPRQYKMAVAERQQADSIVEDAEAEALETMKAMLKSVLTNGNRVRSLFGKTKTRAEIYDGIDNAQDILDLESAVRKDFFTAERINFLVYRKAVDNGFDIRTYSYDMLSIFSNLVKDKADKKLSDAGLPYKYDYEKRELELTENSDFEISESSSEKNEKDELSKNGERFNLELDAFKNKTHKGLLHLGKPLGILKASGINAEEMTISPSVLYGHLKKHSLTTDDLKGLAQSIQSPILVYKHGEHSPNIVVVTELDVKGGKLSASFELDNNGNIVKVSNISSIHSKEANKELLRLFKMGEKDFGKALRWVEKEKVLDWLAPSSYEPSGMQAEEAPFDIANVIRSFENPKVSDENVANDGIKLSLGDGGSRERKQMDEAKMVEMVERVKATGESLGGAEAHVYTSFVDVPEEYKKEVEKGARGWYDPETHTVHVYLPNCASGDEAQRTVFHEKIGHEGIEVLFGGEEGVKDFAKFVFSSCGKEIREKVMEIADQYDPEWKHPDRTNVGTQEYIAKLAENGPQTAEEFSLWRKIKHYLIKAMKKLGLTIRGLMNDKDLRYYLLRAQQSLHVWDKMPEAKKRAMAEQASETEMKESLSNRPRKRKNETTAQYIERLRQWEKWKIALDKASVSNDPLPEEETYHDKWDKQYRTDMEAWRKANGIAEGAEGPSEAPKRAEGESPQEYALRVADHERELDLWQGAPDYFSYLKKAQEDYRKAYEAWKERYDIDEMENVDLQLYGGETPTEGPADEDAYQEQEEIEHNVNSNHDEKPVAVGVDVKRVNQGKNKPQLDVNSIKTVFAHHGEIGGSEVLVTYDKEITPEQQELLRGLNFHEYPTIQELSDAKISEKSDSSKVSDENVADDGIKLSLGDGGSRERKQMDEAKMVEMVERVKATGESLGGAEAHVYTSFVDVPEEYKKEVKKGARGWYDPETHTVHVYLPYCRSGDEAQRTVIHESRLSFLFV